MAMTDFRNWSGKLAEGVGSGAKTEMETKTGIDWEQRGSGF